MEEVELSIEGTRVHGEYHPAARGRAAAVLVHGFRSSLLEFGDLPRRLADAGIHALVIDLRGHGRSQGERGRIGLDRAIADVEAAAAWLRARLGKRAKLALVGHSLGGAHAVGVASRTDLFQALVLAHPVDRIFDELGPAEKVLYHVVGRIGQRRMRRGKPAGTLPRSRVYKSMLHDPAARRRAREVGLLDPRVNVANYAYALTMQASDWARRVDLPTLAISSPHDRVVRPENSERVFDNLRGEVERLRHDGGHSCFLDHDGDLVMDGILIFLRRRLGVRG